MDSTSLLFGTVEKIRDSILEGRIKPGEKLNADGLARELNVSKTPVREALNILAAEGIVMYRPKIGYSVQTMTVKEFVELNEVQQTLELRAYYRILKGNVSLDFEALRAINEKIRRAAEANDYYEIFASNELFHMTIYEKCGNEGLVKAIRKIWNELLIHRYHMFHSHTFISNIVDDHEAILKALEAKDMEGMIRVVDHHFENGIIGTLEEGGQTKGDLLDQVC